MQTNNSNSLAISKTPTWCPKCPIFFNLKLIKDVLNENNISKDKVYLVGGIGCSSLLPLFLDCNKAATLHGRPIPFAIGAAMTNPELKVIVVAGDGDLMGIGLHHLISVFKHNIDLSIIMLNNSVYALTKGQKSPTAMSSFRPIDMLKASGALFVKSVSYDDPGEFKTLVQETILYKGVSFLEVKQPCLIYD